MQSVPVKTLSIPISNPKQICFIISERNSTAAYIANINESKGGSLANGVQTKTVAYPFEQFEIWTRPNFSKLISSEINVGSKVNLLTILYQDYKTRFSKNKRIADE